MAESLLELIVVLQLLALARMKLPFQHMASVGVRFQGRVISRLDDWLIGWLRTTPMGFDALAFQIRMLVSSLPDRT